MQNPGGGLDRLGQHVEDWARRVYRNERQGTMIILHGPSGCGKTMALDFMFAWARRTASTMEWQSNWHHVPSSMRVSWPKTWYRLERERGSENYLLEDIQTTDILFLDDIGAEADRFKSKESTAVLQSILDYRQKKFTFITTNIKKEMWQDHWDMRVSDRLRRNSAVDVSLWHMQSFNL